ncbi:hypothetical protein [uncultured Imperialibacter sp.]|uniref:hypothetical protein n=1 Tax=uncultured Imperialibacter sp. TaxID=1672639 RepID=UPI0030DA454E
MGFRVQTTKDFEIVIAGDGFQKSRILNKAILIQKCFKGYWHKVHGLKGSIKTLKLSAKGVFRYLLNGLTRTKPTWNGHNSSGWKNDILEANGFDERMQYGGQDRELGERLVNMGINGVQIRYSAIVVHLDHKRGYRTQESVLKNRAIRKNTRDFGKRWAEFEIEKNDQLA